MIVTFLECFLKFQLAIESFRGHCEEHLKKTICLYNENWAHVCIWIVHTRGCELKLFLPVRKIKTRICCIGSSKLLKDGYFIHILNINWVFWELLVIIRIICGQNKLFSGNFENSKIKTKKFVDYTFNIYKNEKNGYTTHFKIKFFIFYVK